jgi:hypothetical protein
MANIAGPYGLRPYQLIGSQFNNNSAVREYVMTTNSALAINAGDPIVLSGGQPATITNTGGAITYTVGTTHGLVGVCTGVRYYDPTFKYMVHSNYLPANAITNGYTQVYIKVYEDPDGLFLIQGNAQISATLATALASINKNASMTYPAAVPTNGQSGITLTTSSIATTNTLVLKIVDFYWNPITSTSYQAPNNTLSGNLAATDLYPDIIVKWNFGAHAFYDATGV